MLKVCLIMPLGEQRGGGELMVVHLIQAGRDRGVEWFVVFLQDGPMVQTLRDFGVEVAVIPSGRMRDLVRYVATVKRISAEMKRRKIDLALGWMGTGHLYGGVAARLAGIPAAWYQLGIPLDRGFLDRVAARIPARFIMACSQAGGEAQRPLTPNVPLKIVYPAVELDRFDPSSLPIPAEARKKLGLPESGPIIGIVGRLQHWKGMHVLIGAMPQVLKQHPDAHALIVGGEHAFESDYPEKLRKQIEELKLSDRVLMAGLQKNVPEWMQAMDIFVHASQTEPFGIVIIEAMALGKPVVASDQGGPTEIITPGEHGLLTPFGDSDALAKAILTYLGDPACASRLGAAGKLRAQDFNMNRYAQAIIDCCREGLARA